MPEITGDDILFTAQGAQAAMAEGAAALDSVGADSSGLKQAGAALGAAVGAAGTGLAVAGVAGTVLAGSALGATLGVSATAGLAAGGPLAVVTVPIAMFIGICVWYAETFSATNVRTPAERAAGAADMRAAAGDAFTALQWLEQPAHAAQKKAAQLSGWYATALDALQYIDDNGYGGARSLNESDDALYAAAIAFRNAHSDPLAAFPVPASVRDAMRLSMGKAGVFLGTAAQIAAVKAQVNVSRYTSGPPLTFAQMYASAAAKRRAGLYAGAPLLTFAQMATQGRAPLYAAPLQTFAQLTRGAPAAARPAVAPKKGGGGALLVVAGIVAVVVLV